ncbi:MAG: hypothetical protein ACE366_07635 [Bradymonadia bacterium]
MSKGGLDDMIEALKAEGRIDSKGRFTLDRDKARSKMQKFQLAEPLHYMLLLVEAAVLKGASRLEFKIDTDDMHLRFDGDPFTLEDFDRLYEALLGEDGGAPKQVFKARQALAIGLNAATALTPQFVKVTSGDGETGAMLEMAEADRDSFKDLHPAPTGTHVHLKEPLSSVSASEVFRWMVGTLREVEILTTKCRYAQCEVVVNGKTVSRGLFVTGGEVTAEVKGNDYEGVAALRANQEPPAVHLVKDGVWITTHTLEDEGLPPGFLATVQSGALTKDVSQRNIVMDTAWWDVVRGLKGVAPKLWRMLVEKEGGQRFIPDWLRNRLFDALGGELVGVARAVLDCDLWLSNLGEPIPTRALLMWIQAGDEVPYTHTEGPTVPMPEQPWVIVLDDQRRAALWGFARSHGVTDLKLVDVTEALEAEAVRARHRQAWRLRTAQPDLGSLWCLAKVPIDWKGFVGELGIRGNEDDWISVKLIVDGCLLGERTLPSEIPGLVAVLQGDLTPDETYEGVKIDEALETAAEALHEALERLMLRLAEQLIERPTDDAVRDVLLRYLSANQGWQGLVQAALGLKAKGGEEGPAAQVMGSDTALMRCPLFRDLREQPVRLVDLQAWREEGPITWVDAGAPFWGKSGEVPPRAVRLDLREKRVVTQVFGRKARAEITEDYTRSWWADSHLRKPVTAIQAPDAVQRHALSGWINDMPLEGEVARLEPQKSGWFWTGRQTVHTPMVVRWLRHDRLLAETPIEVSTALRQLGPFVATVDCTAFKPTPDWSGIVHDGACTQALELVSEGVTQLVIEQVQALSADALPPRDVLARMRGVLAAALDNRWLPQTREGTLRPLIEALRSIPLMHRASVRGPLVPMTVDEARAEAAANGRRLYALRRAQSGPELEGARVPVIGDAWSWLEKVVQPHALVDAQPWIEARARRVRFMAQPVIPTALGLGEVVAQVEVTHGDITGVVGLPRGGEEGGWVDVRIEGRALCRLTYHDLKHRVARLQVPEDMADAELTTIARDTGRRKIHQAVIRATDALMARLAEAVDDVREPHPHFLPRVYEALQRTGKRHGALLRTPCFRDLTGKWWSISALRDHLDGERPKAVMGDIELPDPVLRPSDLSVWLHDRVVLRLDVESRDALRAGLAPPTLVENEVKAAVVAHGRQRHTARQPEVPEAALAVERLSWPGGEGWVALVPEGALPQGTSAFKVDRVAVCKHGHVVDHVQLHPHLPCMAVATGAGVDVDASWRHAGLSDDLERRFVNAAMKLYGALIGEYGEAPEDRRQRIGRLLIDWVSTSPEAPAVPSLPREAAEAWRRVTSELHLVDHPHFPTLQKAVDAGASFQQAVDWSERVRLWRLRNTTTALALRGEGEQWAMAPVSVSWPTGQAVLGVSQRAIDVHSVPRPGGAMKVDVFWQSRHLTQRGETSPLGPFHVALVDERLMSTLSLDDIVTGSDYDAVIEQVLGAVPALVEAVIERGALRSDRYWLMAALRAYVPDPALIRALSWLVEEVDDDQSETTLDSALITYAALVRAVEGDPEHLPLIMRKRSAQGMRDALESIGEIALWPLLPEAEVGPPRPLMALLSAPLFTVAGPPESDAPTGQREPLCSLLHVIRSWSPKSKLYISEAVRCEFEPERLVLVPGKSERELLQRLFGAESFEDATDWLKQARRQWALSARPVAEVALAPGDALVTLDIGDGNRTGVGMDGIVGLSSRFQLGVNDAPDPEGLRVYREKRPLGHAPAPDPGLVAAIDDVRLTLNDDLDGVAEGPALERVLRRCKRARADLIKALVVRWPELDPAYRKVALHHVLYTLARQGSHRALQTEAGVAMADVPCLPTVNGPTISLKEAARSRAREGALLYMPHGAPEGESPVDPERRVLWVESDAEQEALRRIFGALQDYSERWALDQKAHQRRASLEPLTIPEDDAVLVKLALTDPEDGLEGAVYLHRQQAHDPRRLTLGGDGLAVATIEAFGRYPVSATLWGRRVEVDESWQSAALGDGGRRAVELAGHRLYTLLAEAYPQWLAEDDPRATPARRVLLELALVFREAQKRNQLDRAARRLYANTLEKLPLLWPHGDSRATLTSASALSSAEVRRQCDQAEIFFGKWPRDPYLSDEMWVQVQIEGRRSGVLGAPVRDLGSIEQLWAWRNRRPLDHLRSDHVIGPVAAAINDDTLIPDLHWSAVERGMDGLRREAWHALAHLVPEVVSKLVGARSRGQRVPGGPWALVCRATGFLAPEPVYLRWAAARHQAAPERLVEEWARMMRITRRHGPKAVAEAIESRLAGGGELDPTSVAAVARDAGSRQRSDLETPGDDGAGEVPPAALAFIEALALRPIWPSQQGPVHLMALCAPLTAGSPVLYADSAGAEHLEQPVIALGEMSASLLREVFGEALLGAGAWARRQAALSRFEARPQVDVAPPPERVLVEVPIDISEDQGGPVTGAVALTTPHPRHTDVQLMVHTRGRHVETIQTHTVAHGRALVGALDHPGLKLDEQLAIRRDDPALTAMVEALVDSPKALMKAVLEAWAGFSEAERQEAGLHVLDHLALESANALKARKGLLKSLRELPILPQVDGTLASLEAIAGAAERAGKVRFLPSMPEIEAPVEADLHVLIADFHVRKRLEKFFGAFQDYTEHHHRLARRHAARTKAPPLPERPEQTLGHTLVDNRGLRGEIWLPLDAEHPAVDFGEEGRALARTSMSVPIAGSIEGPAINIEQGTPLLTRDQSIYLERQGADLYRDLAEALQNDSLERAAKQEARGLLRHLVTVLRQQERREGSAMGRIERALLEDLYDVPVYAVEGGAFISVLTALNERPHSLVHLALWHEEAPAKASQASEPVAASQPEDPEIRVLEAIRQTLKRVRGGNAELLANLHLDRLKMQAYPLRRNAPVVTASGEGCAINPDHALLQPLMKAVRAEQAIAPRELALVASMIYTALNHWHDEITDADEVEFHRRLAVDLLER